MSTVAGEVSGDPHTRTGKSCPLSYTSAGERVTNLWPEDKREASFLELGRERVSSALSAFKHYLTEVLHVKTLFTKGAVLCTQYLTCLRYSAEPRRGGPPADQGLHRPGQGSPRVSAKAQTRWQEQSVAWDRHDPALERVRQRAQRQCGDQTRRIKNELLTRCWVTWAEMKSKLRERSF